MMTLSGIVELARQDSPPPAPGAAAAATIARIERMRALQGRVLLGACAVSVGLAVLAACLAMWVGPATPDPVEELLVSIEWRLP
jgi:hypothetical protein